MTQDNFEPRHKDMSRHVISGFLNSGIIQIVNVFCQFGSVVFLSRLLTPSDFGIFAMAGPVFGFVMMFQNLGLSQATVQKPTLHTEEVNIFFWLNAASGLVLSIILVALSPLAGWYYGDSRVVSLTAALGLLVFINALGSQHGALLQRRMEFGVSSLISTLGSLGGLGVSIAWAILFKGYWAIYFGLLTSTAIPVIGVWIAVRWRPTFPRRVTGIGDMLKFGAAVTTTSLSWFFSRYMDNVLIGHRWGEQALGFYDRAYKLLLFPLQRILDPISATMIPVLSRLTGETERYRGIFLRTLAQIVFVTSPGIIWAIVLADILIPTLLGKTWVNSVDIFRPLAMAGLLQAAGGPIGWLFVTQRRSREMTCWAIFSAVTCVASFAIGLPYGALGVAISYAIGEYIRTPIFWWYSTRHGPVCFSEAFRAILPQIAGALLSALALLGYRQLQIAPIVFLIGGLAVSYATTALAMSLSVHGRETLRQTVDAGRRIALHLTPKPGA